MNQKSNKEMLEILNKTEFEFPNIAKKTFEFRIKSRSTANLPKIEKTKPLLAEILMSLHVKKLTYEYVNPKLLQPIQIKKNGSSHNLNTDPTATRSSTFKCKSFSRIKSNTKQKKTGLKFPFKKFDSQVETVLLPSLQKYRQTALFTPVYINSRFFLPVSEHATMNLSESEDGPKLIFFGGLGNGINFDFVSFDLSSQTFEPIRVNNNGNWARYGHSSTIISIDKILIFGGDKHFRRIINPLENSNQTQVNQNFWQLDMLSGIAEEISSDSCKKPKHRKFHGSCLFDKNYLVIFGGMKINYKFMNDLWIYDIEERVWHEFPIDFEINVFLELGIAHHSLVCLSSEITEISKSDAGIGLNGQNKSSSQNQNEKAQKAIYLFKNHKKNILLDVYLFGGINESNELMDNKLWRLGMKNHDFYFKEVLSKGYLPEKRHSHTLNASPKEKMLIMIGGKSEMGNYLNDVHIFRLQTGIWEQHIFQESPFENGISGHCAETIDNCIFIFGGITNDGFRVPGITFFTFARI